MLRIRAGTAVAVCPQPPRAAPRMAGEVAAPHLHAICGQAPWSSLLPLLPHVEYADWCSPSDYKVASTLHHPRNRRDPRRGDPWRACLASALSPRNRRPSRLSRGTPLRSRATATQSTGTATRSIGTALRNSGMALPNPGMATRSKGTATRSIGTALRNSGMATRSTGTATRLRKEVK